MEDLKCQNQPGKYKSVEKFVEKPVEFLPNKDDEMKAGKCKYNLKQMTKNNTFLEYKLY